MPTMSLPEVAPKVISTIPGLVIVGLLLSGCSAFPLVPAKDLAAERQQRQALQVEQRQLLEQLTNLTEARGELQTRLAAEQATRQALEQRQEDLVRELEEQESALEGLKRLEVKWEQWQAQEQISTSNDLARLELKLEQWQEQVLEQQSEVKQGLDDDARLYLLLLEKKAQIARLTEQLESAILEVVRTKAKLRSQESKAEAASDLAEAEIAIESLKAQGVDWETDPSVIKAEELTRLSAREFEQENYTGALYLTGQAKKVVKSAQARSMNLEMSAMADGEVAFALPLSLRLVGESEVREGPDSNFKSLLSLEKGVTVIGYSYKEQWVRVKTEDGVSGWVYYKKVAGSD